MLVNDVPDVFRWVNVALSLVLIGVMLFDRRAPWRTPHSTLRLYVFSIAGILVWQAYTSVEVLVAESATQFANVNLSDGLRVYGVTFWYSMLLVAVVIERRRSMRIRAAMLDRAVVVRDSKSAAILVVNDPSMPMPLAQQHYRNDSPPSKA